MPLHTVISCHLCCGMQAAIEKRVWMQAVLLNGLVLYPDDDQHLERWMLAYRILYYFVATRWSETDWHARGWRLVRDTRFCHKRRVRPDYDRTRLVPVPLDWGG